MKMDRRGFLRLVGASALAASLGDIGLAAPENGEQQMSSDRNDTQGLKGVLLPANAYHPFPTADERARWEALPAGLRQAAVAAGERRVGSEWPQLPAVLYLDYARTGNRSRYEGHYFGRRNALTSLAIAECVEGKGRFGDDIINGIWAICEESSWVIPAHNSGGALPDSSNHAIDLFAAETGALLAWTHYLLAPRLDAVSGRISERLRREVKARILDPFLARDDFWWMGTDRGRKLNNWSPWCSSTCLSAFLLLEADESRRTQAAEKVMGILDRFLAGYHPDGGCDEGPSYWTVAGAALFDCLEQLRWASDGRLDRYQEPLIQEIGRYIYRVQISGDYFVDFADSPAQVHLPAGLLYRYGRRIGDDAMCALGSSLYGESGEESLLRGSLVRTLPGIFDTDGIAAAASPPYVRDVWLDGTQVMAAREREGSDRGLYLAAKGGNNDENHNHNDVGQFLVYLDGKPVLVDAGVGTYTAKTFSDERYEIWTMQSAYHNLPTVNGVQQREGGEFQASDVSYRSDDSAAEISFDIAGAYPKESGIESWRRTCRLVRGAEARVEIIEDFSLRKSTDDIMLSLITPCEPSVEASGAIRLPVGEESVRLVLGDELAASVEPIALDDERLRDSWGRLFRIVLRPKSPVARGSWSLHVVR